VPRCTTGWLPRWRADPDFTEERGVRRHRTRTAIPIPITSVTQDEPTNGTAVE
jgi:hypothetical protein